MVYPPTDSDGMPAMPIVPPVIDLAPAAIDSNANATAKVATAR